MAPITRLDRTPEPLTEDPFAGGSAVAAPPLEFDGERFTAAGATADEVATLGEHYETLDRAERRRTADWLARSSDDDVAAWLAQWREFVAAAEAESALIDGTVEEVLARVEAAPEEERLDLAERTLAAEQAQEEDDDVRSTLVEGLEHLIARARDAAIDAEAQAQLVDGSVEAVLERVGTDAELAQRTLDAEVALRGDEARKTLVPELERIIGEGAQEPAGGSGAPTTPEGAETTASGSDGAAQGTPDATA